MRHHQFGSRTPHQTRISSLWRGGKNGFLIIEILVAIAVLGTALAAISGLAVFSLKNSRLISKTAQANALAQEAIEQVRNFRDQTFWQTNGLGVLDVNTDYHMEKTPATPPQWIFAAGSETAGQFTRKIVLTNVYRDADDNIAAAGVEDQNTRKTTATVSWLEGTQNHKVELTTYFTNWKQ